MKINAYALRQERLHHDKNAKNYSLRRLTDYIWEVPESLFLLKAKYFQQGKIVIDMGCGPSISIKNILGDNTLKKIKYIGVDISNEMLKLASTFVPMGQFKQGDIETIKFPNNYADVIISLGALHHSINKERTLKNWTNILKRSGYLLLREPTFESLRRGQGESPMEEGIKFNELKKFFKVNNYKIVDFTFFSSGAFHLFNRIMISLHLGEWQKVKQLWYPIVIIDVLLIKILSHFSSFFNGQAFILIVQKI